MKKRFLTVKEFRAILAVIFLVLVLAAGLLALNWRLAGQFGAGADFLPAWQGTRAFLFEQTDPYSRAVAGQTQLEVYGRAAHATEFPYALDIPFPLLVLFFPFALLPDPVWARAVWMTLSELGLLLLAALALRLADWEPKRAFMFLLLAFSLAWYYSLIALADGSFSILLALALVGALMSMRDFHDEFAGFLLAIAAMKWEVTLLLWLFILLGAYSAKRWRVFAGLGMTWFILGAVGFLFYPDWIWPYLRAVTANLRADDTFTPALFLQKWMPEYGARLALLLVAVLLLILVIEWFNASRGKNFPPRGLGRRAGVGRHAPAGIFQHLRQSRAARFFVYAHPALCVGTLGKTSLPYDLAFSPRVFCVAPFPALADNRLAFPPTGWLSSCRPR